MPEETPGGVTIFVDQGEQTGAQSVGTLQEQTIWAKGGTLNTYREMRQNGTIALARAYIAAPVTNGRWGTDAREGAPQEWVDFVESQLFPIRETLVDSVVLSLIDYGWAPFEFVLANGKVDGATRIIVEKLKPLLVDITSILVKTDNGAFAGFLQEQNQRVQLPRENSVLITFRVEGSNWYGTSFLESTRLSYNNSKNASNAARRYDEKIAGAHLKIVYPRARTTVNGVEMTGEQLATRMLDGWKASGAFLVPEDFRIDISFVGDSSPKQSSFTNRLQYLDTQMVRAMLLPERSITEGKFGTKAEAGVHADLALTHLDVIHRAITRQISEQVVDTLLVLNFGPEAKGAVTLTASPLADSKRDILVQAYATLLTNELTGLHEADAIDMDSLRDQLGIPALPIQERRETQPPALAGIEPETAAAMGAVYGQ